MTQFAQKVRAVSDSSCQGMSDESDGQLGPRVENIVGQDSAYARRGQCVTQGPSTAVTHRTNKAGIGLPWVGVPGR